MFYSLKPDGPRLEAGVPGVSFRCHLNAGDHVLGPSSTQLALKQAPISDAELQVANYSYDTVLAPIGELEGKIFLRKSLKSVTLLVSYYEN